MICIDNQSRKYVEIVRRSQVQDGDGNFGLHTETTLYTNALVDIQPLKGNLKETVSGYAETATHIMIPALYLNDLRRQDTVKDGDSEYKIVFVEDYGDHVECLMEPL